MGRLYKNSTENDALWNRFCLRKVKMVFGKNMAVNLWTDRFSFYLCYAKKWTVITFQNMCTTAAKWKWNIYKALYIFGIYLSWTVISLNACRVLRYECVKISRQMWNWIRFQALSVVCIFYNNQKLLISWNDIYCACPSKCRYFRWSSIE